MEPTQLKNAWASSVELLAALDSFARAGCNVLVKVDGLRTNGNAYTVVVNPRDEFFRKDGPRLDALLNDALAFARATNLEPSATMNGWANSVEVLGSLDAFARAGCVFLVQVDGSRVNGDSCMVMVSGGDLRDDLFRKDGLRLEELLADAWAHCRAKAVMSAPRRLR